MKEKDESENQLKTQQFQKTKLTYGIWIHHFAGK